MIESTKKFFDVIIEQDVFHIVETDKKPTGSAISVLNKIEEVIARGLKYDPDYKDEYSTLSNCELLSFLNAKSAEITEGYLSKAAKLNCFAKMMFGQEEKVCSAQTRIENLLPHLELLPNELMQEIASHLPWSDLPKVALLNPHGKVHSDRALLGRARAFGYQGDNFVEATTYLREILEEVEEFSNTGLLPEKYISKKILLINPEKTLQNLKVLTLDDFLQIFIHCPAKQNKGIYSNSFQNLRTFLICCVKNLPIKGVNPNLQNNQGETILHLGVREGQKNVVALLLKLKADPNILDFSGFSPLCLNTSDSEITQLLLDHGAEIDYQTNPDGNTALHFAAQNGQLETAEVLLKNGANPNIQNEKGETPLCLALKKGEEQSGELLLKYNANPNIADRTGASPLIISFNRPKMAKLLLEHGADTNQRIIQNGYTALHLAVAQGQINTVATLLENNADPNVLTHTHQTPLDLAQGSQTMISILLEYICN